MDGPNCCIIDGSSENLNTTMTVRLDDGKSAVVYVCDKCAECTTPPKAKQAYLGWLSIQANKKQEIDDLLAKAKLLGLELVIPNQLATPEQPLVKSDPAPQPMPTQQSDLSVPKMGGKIVDGKVADSRQLATKIDGSVSALGGAVSGATPEYAIRSESKASTDLKAGEVAEIGIVKGRQGLEVAIPIRRAGPTGETTINVVDRGGDADLQRRFKDLASRSQGPSGPPDFIRGGYQVKTVQCPLCRGTCTVQSGKRLCPKCGGHGIIEIEAT